MCGITGFFLKTGVNRHPLYGLSECIHLRHRGPDASGSWISVKRNVGLQHYRLSIIDLTNAGAQPMTSHDSRYVIVFNGEIYNHKSLRSQLESCGFSPVWRGYSDTETLLECIAAWGLKKTLMQTVGMFALALYDTKLNTLSLARDRIGEKPLYYGYVDGGFFFTSELKAIKNCTSKISINYDSINAYLRFGYIPAQSTIYQNVFKLKPAKIINLSEDDVVASLLPIEETYWDVTSLPNYQSKFRHNIGQDKIINQLDLVLTKAVSGQMSSDVPVGLMLSGGVDSSLIAAIMQKESSRPIQTFSLGFEHGLIDEAPLAKKIAQHIGSCHTEVYISSADALALVPQLPQIYCEPFADSSQIPTLFLMGMMKRHVTVTLTGDGADEIFCGYQRYYRTIRMMGVLNRFPVSLRAAMSRLLSALPLAFLNLLAQALAKTDAEELTGDRLKKIAEILSCKDITEVYLGFLTLWKPGKVFINSNESDSIYTRGLPLAPSDLERMMLADIMCYLPDDILVKVDRASMSMGLECRAPFLDHRVVEFAWGLNILQKDCLGTPKGILKQLAGRYIPIEYFQRSKQGFGMPIDTWLRDPLREWAEDILVSAERRHHGLINFEEIRLHWRQHVECERNWGHKLWTFLSLLSWLEYNS